MAWEKRALTIRTNNPRDNAVIDKIRRMAERNAQSGGQLALEILKIFLKVGEHERGDRDIPDRSPGGGEAKRG